MLFNRGKSSGMKMMMILMVVSLLIAFLWNHIPIIKQFAHLILDPTAGILLDWNISWGMVLVTGVITFAISLTQKYTMDHERMRALKQEQKHLQAQMKEFKDNPEKIMEINKKSLGLVSEIWDISMRPAMYTFLPVILFFRWFQDYFAVHPEKIFGMLSWFWSYLILAIIFSMIFRKVLRMP